jgi:hypothetical protein
MKKIMILLAFSLMLFSHLSIASEMNSEKKVLIDKLLEQTGQSAIAVGKQFSNVFIQQMTMMLKETSPDIDPLAFEILEEEVKALIHEELVVNKEVSKIMYPIYSKHFTIEELKKMIEINDTPLGRKIIRVMPEIAQEGMQAGQAYGQTLGPKIQQRLLARFEEEGIKLE